MQAAIRLAFLPDDFEQFASAPFFGSDSSNERKKTVSLSSRTSRAVRLVEGGGAVVAAASVAEPGAAGASAVGAALEADVAAAAFEAAGAPDTGVSAGCELPPQAATVSEPMMRIAGEMRCFVFMAKATVAGAAPVFKTGAATTEPSESS